MAWPINKQIHQLIQFSHRHPYGVATGLGGLYPLGFSPFDIWPCTVLSIAGLYALLISVGREWRPLFITGMAYGLGLYSAGIHWVNVSIHTYGNTPLIISIPMTFALIAFLSLQFGCLAYCFGKVRIYGWPPVLFCLFWIGFELFRTHFLTGFPWLLAGYSLIDTAWAHFAPLFGIYGISLICIIIALSLLYGLQWLLQHRIKHALLMLCLIVLSAGSGILLNQIEWTSPQSDKALNVALLQGNIDQNQKWRPDFYQETLDRYQDLTNRALAMANLNDPIDIIIWPEAAIPQFYHEARPTIDAMDQLTTQHQAAWILGVPTAERAQDNTHLYYNAIMTGGLAKGEYKKQKLVPFGEFVPLTQWLRHLGPFFNLPMSSFTAGTPNQPPLYAKGERVAPYICYEIVYPELVRASAKKASLLLTISNDAWFGQSIAPHQHYQIARMRAMETGRMLVRATNTGITGIVDTKGNNIAQAPMFSTTFLIGQVLPYKGNTPYMLWGNIPIYLLALCCLAILIIRYISHSNLMNRNKPLLRTTL